MKMSMMMRTTIMIITNLTLIMSDHSNRSNVNDDNEGVEKKNQLMTEESQHHTLMPILSVLKSDHNELDVKDDDHKKDTRGRCINTYHPGNLLSREPISPAAPPVFPEKGRFHTKVP